MYEKNVMPESQLPAVFVGREPLKRPLPREMIGPPGMIAVSLPLARLSRLIESPLTFSSQAEDKAR